MIKKQGASLVWTVIIMAVLMTIASTMSSSIIKESQMSVRMDDSTRAYAAAESGVEWAKWCLGYTACNKNLTLNNPYDFKIGSAKYTVTINKDATDSYVYLVESMGSSNNTNRKIEYTIDNPASVYGFGKDESNVLINNVGYAGNLSLPGSFTATFNYWESSSPLKDGQKIGFISKDGANYIAIQFNGSSFDIKSQTPGSESVSVIQKPSSNFTSTKPVAYKIKLQYITGVAAKVEIYALLDGASNYSCIGSKTIQYSSDKYPVFENGVRFRLIKGNINTQTDDVVSTNYGVANIVNGLDALKFADGTSGGYVSNLIWTGITVTTSTKILPLT